MAGHESFAAAEGAIGIARNANKVRIGEFEEPVGKGALSVVYMGNYAEIADILHNCKNNQIVVHLKDCGRTWNDG